MKGETTDTRDAMSVARDVIWSAAKLGEEHATTKQVGFAIGLFDDHQADLILDHWPKPDRDQIPQLRKDVASQLIDWLLEDPATVRNSPASLGRRIGQVSANQEEIAANQQRLELALQNVVARLNDVEENHTPERELELLGEKAELEGLLSRVQGFVRRGPGARR